MHVIANSLIPIFAVIGLGILLKKQNLLTSESTQAFNRFAYFCGLPLFLFHKLGNADDSNGLANQFALTLILATILSLICGWAVAKIQQIDFASRGALIQASLRGNLAFIGVPLVLFVLADLPDRQVDPQTKSAIETGVFLTLAPVIIFYNVVSVIILAVYNQDPGDKFSLGRLLKSIATNPLLIACLAGMIFQKLHWPIPTAIDRTCSIIGASAFPMALVGIGSQLATIGMSGRIREPVSAAIVKCVLCPVFAYWITGLIGLSGAQRTVVLLLSATPTAVSSYVLADQMNADAELAASSVVFSTACSMFTLTGLLLLI